MGADLDGLTETEIAQMKEDIKAKKALVKSWRKALATFNPKRGSAKKRTGPNQRRAAASESSSA